MSVITKQYRETTYGDRYTIEYHPQRDGTWKMFCYEHPYNPFSTLVNDCHLYSSGEVCVSSSYRVDSLDKAKAIATFWIDGYSRYIRTGEFYNGQARINV